jgi:hypothetical protein
MARAQAIDACARTRHIGGRVTAQTQRDALALVVGTHRVKLRVVVISSAAIEKTIGSIATDDAERGAIGRNQTAAIVTDNLKHYTWREPRQGR